MDFAKKMNSSEAFKKAKMIAAETASETSKRRLEKFQIEKNDRILELLSTKFTGTQEFFKKTKTLEQKKYTEIQIGKMNQQLNLMKKIE